MADETAKLAADAVVFRQHDVNSPTEILLIRRKKAPYKGSWAFPGGYVDAGESPGAACVRELAEETDLRLPSSIWTPLPVRADPLRDPRERVVSFPFVTLLTGPRLPVKGKDDAVEARWVPLEDVTYGDLAFDHDKILTDAILYFAPRFRLKK